LANWAECAGRRKSEKKNVSSKANWRYAVDVRRGVRRMKLVMDMMVVVEGLRKEGSSGILWLRSVGK
jgi:hypothetical protein